MNGIAIAFKLNGVETAAVVEPDETLADMLRERMGLTGTKICCEEGECGACTVLVDDKAVTSCIMLAAEADGCSVVTIEGLAVGGELDILQQCFIDEGAVQCGFCTPGMIMSAKGLLLKTGTPTDEEILEALSGNLCRCTGYRSILRAVKKAAGMLVKDDADE